MGFRALVFALGLTASPAASCELALLLAVDVSGSVDPEEYDIQMQGLADALEDRAIMDALITRKAQIAVMHWTGTSRQEIVLDWRPATNEAALLEFARDVRQAERKWRDFSTAIGEALRLAEGAFEPVAGCGRKIVDVSGDGPSNEGVDPKSVRPSLEAQGITVNGLAIEESAQNLAAYYETDVIFGPGAFVMRAETFGDYPKQIRRKLLREVSEVVSSLEPK